MVCTYVRADLDAAMSVVCNRLLPIAVAFGNVFLCAGQAVAACQPGPFPLSLPAQRLDERLQELAHRTGCAVDVDPGLTQDKRSVALSGSLTADQAFIQSVRGSGLEVRPVQGRWHVDRAQQHYFLGAPRCCGRRSHRRASKAT